MHIPDGFLDTKTWLIFDGITLGFLVFAIRKIKKKISDEHIPLLGVLAAFIFAAQMLNFPIAGGTSGHFVGGFLAAILLGPNLALIVMTTILFVQAFIFQDGGITALGANIFNMGIIASYLGFYLYVLSDKMIKSEKLFPIKVIVIGIIVVVISASMCALELAMSNTVPLKPALISMAGFHFLIGIGEGIITYIVLAVLKKFKPDIIKLEKI